MNITTNPRTRIRSQITKAITINNTDKTTNSSTKDKDNNPRIRTRAGIPMPPRPAGSSRRFRLWRVMGT